jgi:hypothetical protein
MDLVVEAFLFEVHLARGRCRHFRLTKTRSATAGEGECVLQLTCFHNVTRGSTAVSGWLQRLVRSIYGDSLPNDSLPLNVQRLRTAASERRPMRVKMIARTPFDQRRRAYRSFENPSWYILILGAPSNNCDRYEGDAKSNDAPHNACWHIAARQPQQERPGQAQRSIPSTGSSRGRQRKQQERDQHQKKGKKDGRH